MRQLGLAAGDHQGGQPRRISGSAIWYPVGRRHDSGLDVDDSAPGTDTGEGRHPVVGNRGGTSLRRGVPSDLLGPRIYPCITRRHLPLHVAVRCRSGRAALYSGRTFADDPSRWSVLCLCWHRRRV